MDTGERLTWPQIRELYPDQWVVLLERYNFMVRPLAKQIHLELAESSEPH
jgi:hypothetical protein